MKTMRLDVQIEADKLARKINNSLSPRMVYVRRGTCYCTAVGSYECNEAFKGRARRVVGVYAPPVMASAIAEDLAVML
jgi:hypothetical protein